MLNEILQNIYMILMVAGMFGALIIADMILGAFYNVKRLNQAFKWSRFSVGIIKGGSVLVANVILTVVITAFPYFIAWYGLQLSQEVLSTITVIVLAIIWAKAIVRYVQKLFEKIRLILDKIVPETVKKE
jgi:hypothetical protein